MSRLFRLARRIAALFRNDAHDREFDEEARAHIEFAIDDYMRQGLSRPAAERIARAKFGLVASAKDAHREARGLAAIDALLFDIRQAVRSLRRDRALSTTTVVTLTVALALNATVFVVMDATLFRGFPLVKQNKSLVFLQERGPTGPRPVPYADVDEWRRQAQAFTGFAFVAARPITFRDHDGRPTFKPLVYVPFAQEAPVLNMHWLARSTSSAILIADAARRAAESNRRGGQRAACKASRHAVTVAITSTTGASPYHRSTYKAPARSR